MDDVTKRLNGIGQESSAYFDVVYNGEAIEASWGQITLSMSKAQSF